jgi:hypothetical protein
MRQSINAASPSIASLAVAIHEPVRPGLPRDWICFDEITVSPVVDGASRHLHAACRALRDKDCRVAARELGAVAAELKGQATRVARREGAAACVDLELARVASWRLAAVAVKLDAAAVAVESNKLDGKAELSALIDGFTCADIERRWLLASESLWYPVCVEAHRHLRDAIDAYARQDRVRAVTDIHRAMGHVRLEAGRAAGYAKRALDGAVAELGRVALSVALGLSRGREAIGNWFPIANLSLALAHRVKAQQWWARRVHGTTGYELKAAALCLQGAAEWAQRDIASGAMRAAQAAAALGERLALGELPARDEVNDGITSFCAAAEAFSSRIAVS